MLPVYSEWLVSLRPGWQQPRLQFDEGPSQLLLVRSARWNKVPRSMRSGRQQSLQSVPAARESGRFVFNIVWRPLALLARQKSAMNLSHSRKSVQRRSAQRQNFQRGVLVGSLVGGALAKNGDGSVEDHAERQH